MLETRSSKQKSATASQPLICPAAHCPALDPLDGEIDDANRGEHRLTHARRSSALGHNRIRVALVQVPVARMKLLTLRPTLLEPFLERF